MKPPKIPVLVQYPEEVLKGIDNLVERGLYASRSEALRDSARILIGMQRGILKDIEPWKSKSGVEIGRETRREMWENYMKRAKGDEDKATKLLYEDLKNLRKKFFWMKS